MLERILSSSSNGATTDERDKYLNEYIPGLIEYYKTEIYPAMGSYSYLSKSKSNLQELNMLIGKLKLYESSGKLYKHDNKVSEEIFAFLDQGNDANKMIISSKAKNIAHVRSLIYSSLRSLPEGNPFQNMYIICGFEQKDWLISRLRTTQHRLLIIEFKKEEEFVSFFSSYILGQDEKLIIYLMFPTLTNSYNSEFLKNVYIPQSSLG